MNPVGDHHALQRDITRFLSQPGVTGPLQRLYSVMDATAELYIVGGALRNVVIDRLHGSAPATEDIDLFIQLPDAELKPDRLFDSGSYEYSDFGGIRWHPENSEYAFDLCRLQDFIVFQKYRLTPTLDNLLIAIDFDINTIVFDLRRERYHESGCLEAVRRRIMDFNSTLFYNRKITAYRILLLRYKLDFGLSRALFDFVKKAVNLETAVFLKGLYNTKLGRSPAAAIMKDYDRICKFRDYRQYRERAPEMQ